MNRHILGFFGALALLLAAAGCSRPEPARPKPFLRSEAMDPEALPLQVLAQFHVIAWRETDSRTDAPFPALGFRLAGDSVIPVSEPETVAGRTISFDRLERWMAALNRTGQASVQLAPSFSIAPNPYPDANPFTTVPRPHAGSRVVRDEPYVANWRFGPEGANAEAAVWSPGLALEIQPRIVPGMPELLMSVDLRFVAGEVEGVQVADGFLFKGSGKDRKRNLRVPPLELQYPRERVQRLVTTLPVRDPCAVILAHYVKQYRAPAAPAPEQRAEIIREHLFYVLSVRRVGREENADLPIVAPPPPARYALSLAWNQWNAGEPPRSAPADAVTKVDPEEARRALQPMRAAPEAVCCALNVAVAAGQTARLEIGEERRYPAALDPDPRRQSGPHTFVIRPVRAGLELEAMPLATEQGGTVELAASLGDILQTRAETLTIPSLRALGPGAVEEQYHVQRGHQMRADARLSVPLTSGGTWRLRLPWRDLGDDPATFPARQIDRIILFTLRELPADPDGNGS